MNDFMHFVANPKARVFALTTATKLNSDLKEFSEKSDFGIGDVEIVTNHEGMPLLLITMTEDIGKELVAVSFKGSAQEINARLGRMTDGCSEDVTSGESRLLATQVDTFLLVELYHQKVAVPFVGYNSPIISPHQTFPFNVEPFTADPNIAPIYHVTCGSNDWEATESEMSEVADLFQAAQAGDVVVTRDGIDVQSIPSSTTFTIGSGTASVFPTVSSSTDNVFSTVDLFADIQDLSKITF